MNNWKKLQWCVSILSVIVLFIIIINAANMLLTSMMLIILFCFIYSFITFQKKLYKQQVEGTINQIEQAHLDKLSHQRHEAMNDIQVLLGYIRLDKKDKCVEYVEKIKERMHQESLLSRLKDYQFINYINELKLCNFPINVEIEFLTDQINWDKQYTQYIIEVISCYQNYRDHEHGDQLLTVYIAVGEQLHIQFEYNGNLLNNSAWKTEIEAKAAKLVHAKRLILTIDEQDINSTFLA